MFINGTERLRIGTNVYGRVWSYLTNYDDPP
jgi:hypothetical protein